MTSANVTYYIVKKDGKKVAKYSQNSMCKDTKTEALKSHIPAEDFTLTLLWPDEYEAPHYTKEMSLADYLLGVKPMWQNEYEDDEYPMVPYEYLVEAQRLNGKLLNILESMIPLCIMCDNEKYATHVDAYYDGDNYLCKKHASKNAYERKDWSEAAQLLRRYKK